MDSDSTPHQDADIPSDKTPLLWLYKPSRILLCFLCTPRMAIRPGNGIGWHLRGTHQLVGEQLQRLLSEYASMPLSDPHVVDLPANGSDAIPQLPIFDGYCCQGCRYLTVNRAKVIRHCKHCKARQSQSRSGSGSGSGSGGWVAVKIQTWSLGRYARYWIVDPTSIGRIAAATETAVSRNDGLVIATATADTTADTTADIDIAWCQMLRQHELDMAGKEKARRQVIHGPGGADTDSTWVHEMGWAIHLAEKDAVRLHTASLSPTATIPTTAAVAAASEAETGQERQQLISLTELTECFDREMLRCSARLERVPHETRRWLRSIDPVKPHSRPFNLTGNASTRAQYQTYWKRYLCYCVRAGQLGRTEAEVEFGIVFDDMQWQILDRILSHLATMPSPSSSQQKKHRHLYLTEEKKQNKEEEKKKNTTTEIDAIWQRYRQRLEKLVFGFCVMSLRQKIAGKIFANPLLHFTAVLGIDGKTGRWREAANYTGRLAGILWCGRILMLEYIFRHIPIEAEVDEIDLDTIERFKAEHQTWLADGSNTPFSVIIRWMAYGKGHRQQEGGMARVLWEDNGKTLRYLGERIAVSAFRSVAQGGIRDMESRLDELVFGSWRAFRQTIEMNRIVDSLLFEGPGRSFATDQRNSWLQPGFHRLAHLGRSALWDVRRRCWHRGRVATYLARLHSFKEILLVNTHIWGGQPGRGPEIMTLRHCDSQQLLRNVFVFDGQLLLVTDRDKNKALRGIGRKVARFLPDSLGQAMVAYITWLLPFERLLHAHSGIRGPSFSLDEFLWKDARKGRWDTSRLSEQLAQMTTLGLGVKLAVADYRHVAIELGRRIQGLVVEQRRLVTGGGGNGGDSSEEEDEGNGSGDIGDSRHHGHGGLDGSLYPLDDEDPLTGEPLRGGGSGGGGVDLVWDLQATHSSKIARAHYAVNQQFPGRLQPQMMATFREISRLWHRFLGDTSISISTTVATVREKPSIEPLIEPSASSSMIFSTTRKKRKRNNSIITSDLLPRNKDKKSRDSHSEYDDDDDDDDDDDIYNDKKKPHIKIEKKATRGLQLLYGLAARWRTVEQKESIHRILLATTTPMTNNVFISILPTGGGKSLLFMIPAILEGRGTSIVVVPFTALIQDLVKRAQALGIDCLQWVSSLAPSPSLRHEGQPWARLVIVSADVINSIAFIAYMEGLRTMSLLQRIFIDECHTIMTDVHYRERLAELINLHRHDCPVILLTATLPVRLEGWFREAMLAQDADIVRASTAKRNIRYRVEVVRPSTSKSKGRQTAAAAAATTMIEDATVAAAARLGRRMVGEQKGVIYCRSRAKCEALAARLGCGYYHSGIADDQQRQDVLQTWLGQATDRFTSLSPSSSSSFSSSSSSSLSSSSSSSSLSSFSLSYHRQKEFEENTSYSHRWIVATTALGTGIDISGIVGILHMERPYGLVDFVQQTGRGARREGEVVESIIIHDGRPAWYDRHAGDIDRLNQQAIEWFVDSIDCRRVVLGSFMDGSDLDCARLDAELCDRCEDRRIQREQAEKTTVATTTTTTTAIIAGQTDRLQQYRKEQARRVAGLRQWLQEAEGRCVVCWLRWLWLGYDQTRGVDALSRAVRHSWNRCPHLSKSEYLVWRRQLTFARFTCCWGCGLPQTWCDTMMGDSGDDEGAAFDVRHGEDTRPLRGGAEMGQRSSYEDEREARRCLHIDQILPIVMMATERSGGLRALLDAEFDLKGYSAPRLCEWLGRRRRMYNTIATNAFAVWDFLIWRYYITKE